MFRFCLSMPATGLAAFLAGIALPAAAQTPPDPEDVAASQQAARALLESLTVRVDGREHPELIPERVRVRSFELRFQSANPVAELGLDPADAASVEAFAADARRAEAAANAAFLALRSDQCEEIAGKSLAEIDGLRLMTSVTELQQRTDDARVARFASLLNDVSPAARQRIEAYIESENVIGLQWSETDWLAFTRRYPESAAANVMRGCARKDDGTLAPVIVSAGRSSAGRSLMSSVRSASIGVAGPRDPEPGAQLGFKRVVSPAELVELLADSDLELRRIDYREVGPYVGTFEFRPGVDAATALDAAAAQFGYSKRAEAYGLQRGVPMVYVPGTGPMDPARPLHLDLAQERIDPGQALRPTREELDAMALPGCIAGDRIEQTVELQGTLQAAMEAACGLRPYAIKVVGDRAIIEAFTESLGDLVANVEFDPPRD